MKIGVGTYALAWSIGVPGHLPAHPLQVLDFLTMAAAADAECVQIADNIPLDRMSQSVWQQILNRSRELSQEIELGMRGLTLNRVIKYLEIGQFMHCNLLRVVIDEENYEPSLDEVISIVRDIIPLLKDSNIRLAVENHDRFSWSDFLQIIQSTDDQWVGMCLDSVNSLGKGEGFFQVAEKLLPYTFNLHIKDYMIIRKSHNMGFDVIGSIAGEGMLPIPWLFEQIQKYNQCHTAILELWTPPEPSIELTIQKEQKWLFKSMNYLKTVR